MSVWKETRHGVGTGWVHLVYRGRDASAAGDAGSRGAGARKRDERWTAGSDHSPRCSMRRRSATPRNRRPPRCAGSPPGPVPSTAPRPHRQAGYRPRRRARRPRPPRPRSARCPPCRRCRRRSPYDGRTAPRCRGSGARYPPSARRSSATRTRPGSVPRVLGGNVTCVPVMSSSSTRAMTSASGRGRYPQFAEVGVPRGTARARQVAAFRSANGASTSRSTSARPDRATTSWTIAAVPQAFAR